MTQKEFSVIAATIPIQPGILLKQNICEKE